MSGQVAILPCGKTRLRLGHRMPLKKLTVFCIWFLPYQRLRGFLGVLPLLSFYLDACFLDAQRDGLNSRLV